MKKWLPGVKVTSLGEALSSLPEIRNKLLNYTVYKPDGRALDRQIKQVLKLYKKYEKKSYFRYFVTCYLLKRMKHIKYRLMLRRYNKYLSKAYPGADEW